MSAAWPSRLSERALYLLMLGYAAGYAALGLLRFSTFHAQIDMSYYLRLVWGIGRGRPDLPLVQAPHFLGLHLEPIVLPLALLGRLGAPLPPLLLVTQAACVALLAWPAYRLGARRLGRGGGLPCAAAALLYPTVTVATLHDFHPVTLALAPLLGVVDALDERRFRRALLLGALALMCREDIALQLGLLAGLCAVAERGPVRLRAAAVLLGLCAYFLVYVALVQPRWLPRSGSYGLHFGTIAGVEIDSGRRLLLLLLSHPGAVARHLMTADRLLYPLALLWPVALLPLLAPWPLLGALPIVAINLLSVFPRVRTIEAHYATAIAPFVIGAAILGAGRAAALLGARWGGAGRRVPQVLLLVCVAIAHYRHGASPLSLGSERFTWPSFRDGPDAPLKRAQVRAVPPGVSVAARPGVLAHLSERPRAISPPEYDDGRPVDVAIIP